MHVGLVLGHFPSSEILVFGFCLQDTICQRKCCLLSAKTPYLPCQQAGLWIPRRIAVSSLLLPQTNPRETRSPSWDPQYVYYFSAFSPKTHADIHSTWITCRIHIYAGKKGRSYRHPFLHKSLGRMFFHRFYIEGIWQCIKYHLTLSYTHPKVSSSLKICT